MKTFLSLIDPHAYLQYLCILTYLCAHIISIYTNINSQ